MTKRAAVYSRDVLLKLLINIILCSDIRDRGLVWESLARTLDTTPDRIYSALWELKRDIESGRDSNFTIRKEYNHD